jgi:NAD(P)-dependent dehydrogenase (short-subunit alcohol dehydrogenase family)
MSKSNLRIIITGGGSGIGAALAVELGGLGHSVLICGRRADKLQEVAGHSHNINTFQCDVSDEDDVIAFVQYVSHENDGVDVVINCAGVFGAIGRFDQTDSALWRKTIDINLFGTYLISKHFMDLLLKSNVRRIVNFAGGGAFNAFPNYSAYAVSKAAVVRFSENMAAEFVDLGVLVNCIAPGFVATEIHDATLSVGEEMAGASHFKETEGKLVSGAVPMELPVECVKFLISSAADGLSGKTISASFDRWSSPEFEQSVKEINESDLYTMRRVNLQNLDAQDGLRIKLQVED